MKQHLPLDPYNSIGHPLYQLNESIQRLQEEHVLLKIKLVELYGMAKAIGLNEDAINWIGVLRDLKRKATVFKRELEAHSKWEEEHMFPLITWYFGEEMDQFTLMEQEHELAKQYFNAYFEAVERNSQPVKGPEAHEMASYLLQAFTLLNHHPESVKDC
ncbi:hemerythrin domain-containing protein [Paenibacillus filicis]|uniref:Hemerythrin domain-containing protein n=1 Tax=Paenibacillus gyeongsangnamensis TaxID=3388067 RepID=A0ABT4QM66_9BACL|nr:hemerythrin domain-containing protein [Paenibacillus filicis]MCZ8517836.1 hemerythrin domain-containing protein [Paenibacillus filicis]